MLTDGHALAPPDVEPPTQEQIQTLEDEARFAASLPLPPDDDDDGEVSEFY